VLAVGTAARAAGHEVAVFVEAWNGVPVAELPSFDVVGAAVTGSNLSRVAALFDGLRAARPGIRLVAGGPHATLLPTDVARIADVVVRDEGEVTFVALLAALARGDDLAGVEGLSFRRGGRTIHTPRRAFTKSAGAASDLSLLRGFSRRSKAAQLLRQGGLYTGYATSSRGCPYPCTFCYENLIGGTGFRKAELAAFIADVRHKRATLGTRTFLLADSNFTTSPGHCREILKAIIDADLGCRFSALCRADVGRWPDVLDLMRRAGFESLILGIEAVDDARLQQIHKKQTTDATSTAIRAIQAAGLSVFGLFMLGFDEDTVDAPRAVAAYAAAHQLTGLSIYCLTEYPSLPGRTLPRYRICETDLDYYNGHFVTTFPMLARPSAFERAVFDALLDYHHPRKLVGSLRRGDLLTAQLHLAHYLQLRKLQRVSEQHQARLRRVEAPYYDARGRLRVDVLKARPIVTAPLSDDLLARWPEPGEPQVAERLISIGRAPAPRDDDRAEEGGRSRPVTR